MKKTLILSLITLISLSVFAQTLDYTLDGRHYYIASPNGRYYTGTVNEGPGCFFDAQTKQHYSTQTDSVLIFAVNNDGIACGAIEGQPAIWIRGGEWKTLSALETINNHPITGGEICGMSADATKFIALMRYNNTSIPVYFELDKFENFDNPDAWQYSTLPTPTKDDLIYRQTAQFVQICGMNYDGTRILGRYRLYDGKREVPFIWQLDADGVWHINFVAQRCLFIEDVVNGTLTFPDDREQMTNSEEVIDYDILREAYELGYILDLSPYSLLSWTGSGRYLPICVNAVNDKLSGDYAAVIDIDADTLIVFTGVDGAGTISVNDNGEAMIYTPKQSTFRTSYVASINNPTQATPLIDYTLQRTNSLIDLTPHMTYQRDVDFDENPIYQTASGSAVWATEGNAYVTYNYDEWNETLIPQCFIVRFDASTPTTNVVDQAIIAYPNPTDGIVYLSGDLQNIQLHNITGALVHTQTSVSQTLDITHLPQGIYILSAFDGNKQITQKIIKQ